MTLTQRVQKDMVAAMKSKEELRLSTLRMMKAALMNKRIDKRADLDEKEELQVFSTLIKSSRKMNEEEEKTGTKKPLPCGTVNCAYIPDMIFEQFPCPRCCCYVAGGLFGPPALLYQRCLRNTGPSSPPTCPTFTR